MKPPSVTATRWLSASPVSGEADTDGVTAGTAASKSSATVVTGCDGVPCKSSTHLPDDAAQSTGTVPVDVLAAIFRRT